jgi:uncharacterized membrane protein YczE
MPPSVTWIDRIQPRAYGQFAIQVATNLLGISLFAVGVVLTLDSGLGLGPWDVLNQGISRHTPISFGQASQLVSVIIVAVNLFLRVRPGLGTILNSLGIGFVVDRILGSHVVPPMAPLGLLAQLTMDGAGVVLVGLGTGLYIRANLGAGPRDGLMLGLHRATGQRIAVTRAALELTAATSGFILGGAVGIGTFIFALGIGPIVEASFRVFRVTRPSRVVLQSDAVDNPE